MFESDEPFEKKTQKFQRCLNQSVQKCFRKIRIRKNPKESDVDRLLKMKSKLNIFLQTSQCEKSIKIAHIKIGSLDQKIKELSSVRNVQIVEDYIRNLECDEKFSHCGMWKLRKKLHPSKQMDPPMAKLDKD